MTKETIEEKIAAREAAELKLFKYRSPTINPQPLFEGFVQGRAGEPFSLMRLADHLGSDLETAHYLLVKYPDLTRGGPSLDGSSRGKPGRETLYNSVQQGLPPSEEGLEIIRRQEAARRLSWEEKQKGMRDQMISEEIRDDMTERARLYGRRPKLSAAAYNGVIRIRTAEDQEEFNQRFKRRPVSNKRR